MKHSCGAILYSYDTNGNLGIILGMEGWEWFPFKGCMAFGETFEETAIREIYEETCGLVSLQTIFLEHHFNSKHKHYHIGLVPVDYSLIDKFNQRIKTEERMEFLEKKCIKFFTIDELKICNLHQITKASINFFWDKLLLLSKNKCHTLDENLHVRNRSITYNMCRFYNKKYDFCTRKKRDYENWRKSITV